MTSPSHHSQNSSGKGLPGNWNKWKDPGLVGVRTVCVCVCVCVGGWVPREGQGGRTEGGVEFQGGEGGAGAQ